MRLSTRSPIPSPGKTVLSLVVQGTFCAVGIICMFVQPAALPTTYTLSVALAVLLAWSILSWMLADRPIFDPYCIFLIAAFLFNSGQGLLEVIDSNELGILGGIFSETIVKQTLVLSFTGLAALHFGALLTLCVTPVRIVSPRWMMQDADLWARRIGWALLVVATPAAAISLTQTISVVAQSGYASLYDRDFQAGVAATPFLLSGLLVPGAFLLMAGGREHTFDRRVASSVIIALVLVQFYIGYRSTAAMPLIAWMWLQHRIIKPIRWSAILISATVLVFVVFPLIRETRNMAANERSTESYWSMFASVDNPAISSIFEMGSTMGTTAHTLTLVPSSRPFDQGVGYAYGLLTIFPNLFWDIHPTIERGTANDWLVRSVNPWLAARGGAYGYSCIAEAYLNFGQPGVPLMMALYGVLLVSLILWSERSGDISKIVLVATILAFTLRFPRDEIAGVIRPVFWYGLAPFIAMVFLPRIAMGAIKTGRVSRTRPLRGAHS